MFGTYGQPVRSMARTSRAAPARSTRRMPGRHMNQRREGSFGYGPKSPPSGPAPRRCPTTSRWRSRVAVEARHPSWFEDDIGGVLSAHGAAWCLADGGPQEPPRWRTADGGYLRFHRGQGRPPGCYRVTWTTLVAPVPEKVLGKCPSPGGAFVVLVASRERHAG